MCSRGLSSLKEGAPCQGSDEVARAIAAKAREGCTSSGKRISLAAKDAIAHLNVRWGDGGDDNDDEVIEFEIWPLS